MLTLIDGPCQGTYWCKRAPVFLRAVLGSKGATDVLDQVEDTPQDSEAVHVYQREGEAGWVHIHGKKVHGFFAMGTYRHLADVDGVALRDNEAWQSWATARVMNLKEVKDGQTEEGDVSRVQEQNRPA